MNTDAPLDAFVPEPYRHLEDPARDLPRLAKDPSAMTKIGAAVAQVPTRHRLLLGDARRAVLLSESVHLVLTSPPYWTLKEYRRSEGQLGWVADYDEFLDQLDEVWRLCHRALVPGGRLICVVISHVCINAQNTWAEFCRAYALSTVRAPIRRGGQAIVLGDRAIRTEADVVGAAIKRLKSHVCQRGNWTRRDEPPWHDPNTLLHTLEEMDASNVDDLRSAFSLGSRVFEDLPVFRNFYAHRSEYYRQEGTENRLQVRDSRARTSHGYSVPDVSEGVTTRDSGVDRRYLGDGPNGMRLEFRGVLQHGV